MPGLHHEVFIGKDNAMPMAAPGHHSYTWPFHTPAKNLWWVAAENVMRRQWFQAKPKEGITTRLAQRDSYAGRSNTYITWACALFASNRFLWRYTRMGSSQQISVSGCWTNLTDEFVTEEAVCNFHLLHERSKFVYNTTYSPCLSSGLSSTPNTTFLYLTTEQMNMFVYFPEILMKRPKTTMLTDLNMDGIHIAWTT